MKSKKNDPPLYYDLCVGVPISLVGAFSVIVKTDGSCVGLVPALAGLTRDTRRRIYDRETSQEC